MKVTDYHFFNPHESNMKVSYSQSINLNRPDNHKPYPVALGIDASTTSTGVTVGNVDSDAPFLFLEFTRDKGESINQFLNEVLNVLTYRIIMINNLEVQHIFIEDKYEDKTKFSKVAQDSLATVKIIMKDLPGMISQATGFPKAKYHLFPPQTWRKYYLGDLNTNKGRAVMKKIVAEFGRDKYNLHPQCVYFDDVMDSIGIYSAGIISVVKPESKDNVIAEVIPNDIDWIHHIEKKVYFEQPNKDMLTNIINKDTEMRERMDKYGFKMYEYYRGISVEKNIRALTTNSNALFITV